MATGDSDDIRLRVQKVLPRRWWQWAAPYRDAVLGGLSDMAAWCYQWIIYAQSQTRISTATGLWLDIISFDYLGLNLPRAGLDDDTFRALIIATILKERVTRAGMSNAVLALTGTAPWIFEPWNTGDTGAYSNFATGTLYGQFGYGVGNGGWGNMNLPGQLFMKVVRGSNSGIANVNGYGGFAGGYAGPDLVAGQSRPFGTIEYAGFSSRLIGVTDEIIENLITYTRPTGVIVWLYIY